ARQRGRLLAKTADLLEARLDEFARLETAHNGKTLFESKIELGMTVNTLRYYGGWADKIVGDTLPVEGPFFTYTLREPIGVVGAIVPWNFPLNIASWKFAPALAAGCTVILKPASETPLTALLFAEIALEAGLPPGAFNVVPGGKSPNIIFADADLKAAVRGAQTGIFYGKGEVCAAGSRLLVEKSVHAQVIEQLAEGAKKMTPGDPLDKNTRLGALVSKKQQETVLSYIKKGVDEGAQLVAGGKAAKPNGKGYYVEATVFDRVQPEMTIAREEIFGPVLAVLTFDDFEQGVKLANNTIYGLAAGIWTKDIQKAHRAAKAIRAGTVWINSYNSYDSGAPVGGFKASGFGRDLGREALDGYLETKTVWVAL